MKISCRCVAGEIIKRNERETAGSWKFNFHPSPFSLSRVHGAKPKPHGCIMNDEIFLHLAVGCVWTN
jgi:hypothetical protein